MAQSVEQKKAARIAKRLARTDEQVAADRVKNASYMRAYTLKVAADPAKADNARRKRLARVRKWRGIVGATDERRVGPCDVCAKVRSLLLDHDHETGAIRGWLCAPCNSFIGRTKADAIARAQRVLSYVGAPV